MADDADRSTVCLFEDGIETIPTNVLYKYELIPNTILYLYIYGVNLLFDVWILCLVLGALAR